jgi:hypothetical protein
MGEGKDSPKRSRFPFTESRYGWIVENGCAKGNKKRVPAGSPVNPTKATSNLHALEDPAAAGVEHIPSLQLVTELSEIEKQIVDGTKLNAPSQTGAALRNVFHLRKEVPSIDVGVCRPPNDELAVEHRIALMTQKDSAYSPTRPDK